MKSKAIGSMLSGALALGLALPAAAQMSDDVVKIGLITDMTGPLSDPDGRGGVEAVKMAIADFGGSVNGKKIEFLSFDHQNKADLGATKAREWFDREGVDMIISGPNSSVGLAIAKIAREKKKPFIPIGSTTSRLTNEECSPYTVQYAYDTVALAKGTGSAVLKQGGKSWFFLTADFQFGTDIERVATEVIKKDGGQVLGSVRHPLGASDFSSFLVQAQSSKAQVLGLANAGADTVNSIKATKEFGVDKHMKMVAMHLYINDVNALGLNVAQGLYVTDGWYWDLNDQTRAWSKKFFARVGKMPSLLQAADYSATMHYLNAVKATGTDDGDKVMAQMKATKINDFFARNGYIRADGRMVHDMYFMQVKTPAESKYPWDYYKLVQTFPGEQVAITKAESKCELWK